MGDKDLVAWEPKTKVKIASGDVLLIRTGRWAHLRQKGQWNFLQEAAGSYASLALAEGEGRGGDRLRRRERCHAFGRRGPGQSAARAGAGDLGMPLLDNLDLDPLAREVRQRGR